MLFGVAVDCDYQRQSSKLCIKQTYQVILGKIQIFLQYNETVNIE